jgi:Tfp pilus assembly protein PilN
MRQVVEHSGSSIDDDEANWRITMLTNMCGYLGSEKVESLRDLLGQASLQVTSWDDAYLDSPAAGYVCESKPSVIAVGLAMGQLGFDCGLDVNLLGDEVNEVKTKREHTLVIANAAALVLFAMIVSIGIFQIKARRVNEKPAVENGRLNLGTLGPVVSRLQELDGEIDYVCKSLDNISSAVETTSALSWDKILADLAIVTPKSVMISRLSSPSNSRIMLEGSSLSYEAVRLFVEMLGTSKHVESVNLIGTQKEADSDGWVKYSIECSLVK